MKNINIKNAISLRRGTICEDWDICVDGVWYSVEYMDTSDRAMLRDIIEENHLEIKGIPFWNSCDKTENMGYKKMVYVSSDEAYLIELED